MACVHGSGERWKEESGRDAPAMRCAVTPEPAPLTPSFPHRVIHGRGAAELGLGDPGRAYNLLAMRGEGLPEQAIPLTIGKYPARLCGRLPCTLRGCIITLDPVCCSAANHEWIVALPQLEQIAAVRVAIHDFLYGDRAGLPVELYTVADVEEKTDAVYAHVYRVYPVVPSPFYGAVAM